MRICIIVVLIIVFVLMFMFICVVMVMMAFREFNRFDTAACTNCPYFISPGCLQCIVQPRFHPKAIVNDNISLR